MMSETLLVFYSNSGHTARVAQAIQQSLAVDQYQIKLLDPTEPQKALAVPGSSARRRAINETPAIVTDFPDLSEYQNIILGYPIWSNGVALPMVSFLNAAAIDQQVIFPFSTSGGSGLGDSISYLRKKLPAATVHDGFTVRQLTTNLTADIQRLKQALKR